MKIVLDEYLAFDLHSVWWSHFTINFSLSTAGSNVSTNPFGHLPWYKSAVNIHCDANHEIPDDSWLWFLPFRTLSPIYSYHSSCRIPNPTNTQLAHLTLSFSKTNLHLHSYLCKLQWLYYRLSHLKCLTDLSSHWNQIWNWLMTYHLVSWKFLYSKFIL